MSAGRNANVMPGKARGNCSRSAWTYSIGRPVAFLQLDLDVAVLRTDHAGVVVGHVDAADRHADIVGQRLDLARRNDLADRLLHVGELVGGFLDAGADLGADMHQDRAGIDRRERNCARETAPAGTKRATKPRKPITNIGRRRHRQRQQIAIAAADALEAAPRSRAGTAPADCATAAAPRLRRDGHAAAADISPSSAPACATG